MRPPKENLHYYYKSYYEPKRSSRTVGVESGDGTKDRRAGFVKTKVLVGTERDIEGRLDRRMRMKDEALELADFLEKNMVASVAILGDVTTAHIVATIRGLSKENKLLHQGMEDAFKASESLLDWAKAKRGIVNEIKSFDEEEFYKVAYSYRSWPASDPVGVGSRYRDLLDFVTKETN